MKDRSQARHADTLLRQAKQDLTKRQFRFSLRMLLAHLMAVFVLYSPAMVIGAGLFLMVFHQFQIGSVIFGSVLIASGWVILPSRSKNTTRTFRRDELPHLFSLMDEIGHHLGTKAPEGVHLDEQANAYIAHFKPVMQKEEWVLGLGFTLWQALSPQERIALLAHEMAHKVNQDPARGRFLGGAMDVLEKQYEAFSTPNIMYRESFVDAIGDLISSVFRGLIALAYRFLLSSVFFESQRAEYRADASGTAISGRPAFVTMLEKLTRISVADEALHGLYPFTHHQDGSVFDLLGHSISHADPETRQTLLESAAKEMRRVDQSHPPTAMRIEFSQSLPSDFEDPKIDADHVRFDLIDQELKPPKDDLGRAWMMDLHAEAFDR